MAHPGGHVLIGWVHPLESTYIHPVLCWGSYDGTTHYVATTTGHRWPEDVIASLDTEAEVVALLLRGYKLIVAAPGLSKETVDWIRRPYL